MPKLYDATTGAELGQITDGQLEFWQDQLEEESPEDQDPYPSRKPWIASPNRARTQPS